MKSINVCFHEEWRQLMKAINVWISIQEGLELKLKTKAGAANEGTHLFIFIKLKKNSKKNSETASEEKWVKQ